MSVTNPSEPIASDVQADDAEQLSVQIARIVADNRSENVVILDLRGLSNLADFFVIATGTSDRQMHAVAEMIRTYAKGVGRRPMNVADTRDATWILADYVDVVIHLFDAKHRDYYDLDGLWGDAPQVEWRPDDRQGLPLPNAPNQA